MLVTRKPFKPVYEILSNITGEVIGQFEKFDYACEYVCICSAGDLVIEAIRTGGDSMLVKRKPFKPVYEIIDTVTGEVIGQFERFDYAYEYFCFCPAGDFVIETIGRCQKC